MPYNLEDDESRLKNESPYEMSDSDWDAMQQRIKTKVLGAVSEKIQPATVKKFHYLKVSVAAASVLILITFAFTYFSGRNEMNKIQSNTDNVASGQTMNPEQKLDIAISNLNETELNFSHQISENEISEQNEYSDN